MGSAIRFVDSHQHLDHVASHHPERVAWMRRHGCAPVAWSFAHRSDSVADLATYHRAQVRSVEDAAAAGLHCCFLIGIHPRNIPPDLEIAQVPGLLRPYLEHPLCRGIGEIGLERGTPRELEVLTAQLALWPDLARRALRFGVHTPRADKRRVTGLLLEVLAGADVPAALVVVDHCTPETVGSVLDAGHWAGITVSPAKCTPEDVYEIAAREQKRLDRVMLNTDSGTEFHEALWHLSRDPELPAARRDPLLRDTALEIFRIP